MAAEASMAAEAYGYLSAGIGAGLVTLGAGLGIGKIAGSAMDGTARQPEATADIRTSMIIAAALIEGVDSTGNISVTAALAILAFIAIQLAGILYNGFFGYFRGLIPPGLPAWLLPIMIPVEVVSLLTKPFALCIRLFANMTAGHVVILSMIGLIFILKSLLVAPLSILFALGVYLLEIFVALVQAYVFTLLSSVFIGMAVHQEH